MHGAAFLASPLAPTSYLFPNEARTTTAWTQQESDRRRHRSRYNNSKSPPLWWSFNWLRHHPSTGSSLFSSYNLERCVCYNNLYRVDYRVSLHSRQRLACADFARSCWRCHVFGGHATTLCLLSFMSRREGLYVKIFER